MDSTPSPMSLAAALALPRTSGCRCLAAVGSSEVHVQLYVDGPELAMKLEVSISTGKLRQCRVKGVLRHTQRLMARACFCHVLIAQQCAQDVDLCVTLCAGRIHKGVS
jgi:hypothetical protein